MTISGGSGDWSYQVDYPVTISGGAYLLALTLALRSSSRTQKRILILARWWRKNCAETLFL
jgi:hypothetical protein